MKKLQILSVLAGIGVLAGCASQPPRELLDARAAYAQTSRAPNANLVQTDVYEAKKSLDVAEASFSNDGDSTETRDLSYIAQRKALSAKARAEAMEAIQQKKTAEADLQKFNSRQLDVAKGQLASQSQMLASERQARAAAEAATAAALARIEGMQQKQDDKGRMVLTLNGSVLFATGKSELLSAAQSRLQQVVDALKEDKRSITILGHTDDVGKDEANMQLSQRRADAVKSFLTSHGIPAERVKAQGMGESQPIADNTSPEGRANNRRVEIVLEDAQGGGTGVNSTGGSGSTGASGSTGSMGSGSTGSGTHSTGSGSGSTGTGTGTAGSGGVNNNTGTSGTRR